MKYLYNLSLAGLLLVHCKQHPAPANTVVIADDTGQALILPEAPNDEKNDDSLLVIPDTARIVVGTFSRKENLEPDSEEYTFCQKWKLDSGTIVAIIRKFTPIKGTTWHYAYDSFDCELVGNVQIGGRPYKMYINAGSYFFLTTGDDQFLFGDEKNEFNKYFLEGNVYDAYLEDN